MSTRRADEGTLREQMDYHPPREGRTMSRDRHDHEMHPRCPPLGGEVPFRHCRQVNAGLPCHRVVEG